MRLFDICLFFLVAQVMAKPTKLSSQRRHLIKIIKKGRGRRRFYEKPLIN